MTLKIGVMADETSALHQMNNILKYIQIKKTVSLYLDGPFNTFS